MQYAPDPVLRRVPRASGINRIVDCYEYADERVPRASGDKRCATNGTGQM
ncbi:hypothetical protein OHD37_14845 [Escherichia coli]|nr:hypothetical protein [Escherichia coli]